MSGRRRVRRALLLLAALAASAGAGLFTLASTEPGLRLAWRIAAPLLPASIAVDSVRGRLVGPLVIAGFSFTSDRVRVTVRHATIDWAPRPLLDRVLDVRELAASGVAVELRPSRSDRVPRSTPGPSPFALPFEIRLTEAVVREIGLAGFPAAVPESVDSLALVEASYQSEVSVGELEAWSPDGFASVSGRLRTQERYPFALEVSGLLRPPEPYGEIELEARTSGDMDEARLDLVVRQPLGLVAAAELRDLLGARIVDADVTVDETEFRAITSEGPSGRAGGTVHAAGPMDSLRIDGSGRLSTPETGAVDIEFDLERRPDHVLVRRLLALLDATRIEAEGTVRLEAGEPDIDARVGWSDARWPLLGEPRFRSRSGSATLRGSTQVYGARVDAALDVVRDRPLGGTVALVGTGSAESFDIEALDLDVLEGTLRLDGRVAWQPDLRWQLTFRGENLQADALVSDTSRYPVRLSPRGRTAGEWVADRISASLTLDTLAGSIRGDSVRGSATVAVTGTTRAYRARVEAELSAHDRPDLGGTLRLVGSGSSDAAQIDSVEVAALGGTLRAEGRVAWASGVRWSAAVDADDLGVGRFLPDSTLRDARLGLRGRASGERVPDRVSASVAIDTLVGVVRGEELSGAIVAEVAVPWGPGGPRLEQGRAAVERMDVAWQEARLQGAGVIHDTVDVSLRMSVPDLSVAAPGIRGRAALDLRARGPRAQPTAELAITAHEVAIDSTAASPSLFDSLAVALSGTPGAHEAELQAARGEGTLDVTLGGTYLDRGWSGTLDRFDLDTPDLGPWGLDRSVVVTASPDSVVLEQSCLLQEASRACASALWRAGGTSSAEVVLEELTGQRLAALLPPAWAISGRLGARAGGTLEADGTLRGEAHLDLGSGTIELGRSASTRRLTYRDLALDAAVDEEGARLSMATELFDESGAPAVSTEVDMTLPGYRNIREPISDQPLAGHVRSTITDLSAFRFALPDLEPVGGSVDVDLVFSGSVANAEVEGEARVQAGALDVPRAGLELRDIEVLLRGRGADGIELDASVRSDSEPLTIEGRAPVGPTESEPARIRVSGTRWRALGLPDANVWISPDLELTAWPEGLRLSGDIGVPTARIELTEIPASAIRASDDVIFVDDTTSLSLARSLRFSVRLTLGDSITFRGFGLSGEPVGSLALSDGPGGAVVVRGDITLEEGRYQAYGQELTMERGRLLFAGGPPDDPGLDIRASRTASDGTVAGLEVRGTLKDPEVSIFSEPAMMESQALAYIVLGRPMNSSSEADGSRMADAAIALGLQRGNEIATRLGRSLGLDEMTVEAGGTLEEASLVAGTYVAPDLYISYGVGLFEPVSIFRIRYMLSRRWTLRAETGEANSADLLFRFERGRVTPGGSGRER